MQHKSRSTAFTLVEILVVLAIIAVLAAILLAVFSCVREQARASTCRTNLKQLALAVQLYTQDNGSFPFMPDEYHLAPYIKGVSGTRKLSSCPSQFHTNSLAPEYDYNYNGDLQDLSIGLGHGKVDSVVQKPATTWLQADMVDFPPDDAHSPIVTPAKGVPCVFTTTWHSGGANYSFVDGHVKWLLPESACEIYNSNLS